jgi:hypothetical protein
LPPVPRTGAYFGAWRGPGPGRLSNPSLNIEALEKAVGRKFAIDHQYYEWGESLPTAYDRWTLAQGRIPMISVCACRFATGAKIRWHAIASGTYDRYLGSIADGFAAMAGPMFFLFDSEPESWVGTKGTTADYKAAWRHVVTVFRAHGADNVAFMWTTTAYAFTQESGQRTTVTNLYPGDAYVDWIASDPYNFFKQGAWRSLSDELVDWYAWARATHPTKPLALAEWGSKEDPSKPGRKAQWLRNALHDLEAKYRAIKAVVYFDEQKHENGTINDWRVDSSSTSLSAFAAITRSSWFKLRLTRKN